MHMPQFNKASKIPVVTYRPEQGLCPICNHILKRDHIFWRKHLTFSTGAKVVTSWAYRCSNQDCGGGEQLYVSTKAESIHLKFRRFSRELITKIGYRRFWCHQTMYEIYDWLIQELHLELSDRQVMHLIGDFLALLKAAQPAKIRRELSCLSELAIGVDGMQPEKGNNCLYIVRELQCGVTLLAENLEESSKDALCERILEPLKDLAQELGLAWRGVVSDAQETLQLAVAQSLKGVPHQACQSHCLRDAGKLTFEADRAMKTDIKASFRHAIPRLRKRIQALPVEDPFRAVLLDYVSVIRSLLLEGGIAPFEMGGIKVFNALEDLESSVVRCQKKATTSCCAV
jgi:hypothetical protein